jgi:uncharacterized SAM-binding protein YcdF (DUF218 family)
LFITGKILASLVFPPGLFIVLIVVALILMRFGKRKAATILLVVNAALCYFMSTNAVAGILVAPLENAYPPVSEAADAAAIVVLGGGYNDRSPEYGGEPSLSPEAEKRAIYGLELSRRFNLPLVYSGGIGFDLHTTASEAEAAGHLWRRLGVPIERITLEKTSVDTKTNASNVAELMKGKKIVLVTSAYHMPRAILSFKKARMNVIPAPTCYRAKRSAITWADFLPNAGALETSFAALHEYGGIVYYNLGK